MDNKYLILVNKENSMKQEDVYHIVPVASLYAPNRSLEEETYQSFLEFQKFLKDNGIQIEIESGYRSRDYQQKVWDEVVEEKGVEHAQKYVAKPGYSEHQTGLAVDYVLYENGDFLEEHELNNHPALDFIHEHAHQFGFIVRYPKDKESITGYYYEPWHLRYIKDKKIAKYIHEHNLCLEEYLLETSV